MRKLDKSHEVECTANGAREGLRERGDLELSCQVKLDDEPRTHRETNSSDTETWSSYIWAGDDQKRDQKAISRKIKETQNDTTGS